MTVEFNYNIDNQQGSTSIDGSTEHQENKYVGPLTVAVSESSEEAYVTFLALYTKQVNLSQASFELTSKNPTASLNEENISIEMLWRPQ